MIIFSIPSIVTETHFNLINTSNMIKKSLILQEKKDRCNSLGLYYYYWKLEYIVIDYKNPALIVTKKLTANVFINNLITLMFNKLFSIKEKKIFLD